MKQMSLQFKRFMAATFGLALAVSGSAVSADVAKGVEFLSAGDPEQAVREFQTALEGGDGEGGFYLGRIVELAPQPNMPEAVAFYTQGAELGSPAAKNRLGLLYLEGVHVLQDFEEGARLVCEAADAGESNGQFNCAIAHLDGQGVEPNEVKALEYAALAADQGNVAAMNLMGQSHITGSGVEVDNVKAVEFFQQTAAMGNPVGLFSVGQAFALGIGLDRDLVKAHAFFNLAASRGHPEALQARQAVEGELEREQVIEAQRFARAWRPQEDEADAPTAEVAE